ncbi:GGDEF domain-containing protein [Pseudoalteromonas xiamenensis]|uniref:diguanylate cyclase n=1 Tax=Pseudoalteromonas xiamenensis TaxID=882626 RepID=A0A975DK31_9GAMM|nr:GGDEF domain-containing protein [Pseudoalteromonas xiamenensis]QTH72994.1 GGDEF domain-containing protein [Pseudoalteromonas xiamenensis]
MSDFGISSNEFPNFFFLSGTIKWIEFISIDQIGVEFYFIYPFDYILSLVWSRYGFQISLIFFLNFILVSVFLYYFLGRLSSLKFKSNHDFLTNLMNRRGLYSYLRDMDVDNKLYICLMDLDDFKVFNDKNGHLAGDEALRYISGMIRQTPFVLQAFRIGGEEFLLFSKSRNAILEFKELKDSIYINEFSFCNKKYQISSSMGVVLCENAKDTNIDTYIALADEALYEAKRRGKNLLCVKKDESCDFDVY